MSRWRKQSAPTRGIPQTCLVCGETTHFITRISMIDDRKINGDAWCCIGKDCCDKLEEKIRDKRRSVDEPDGQK